MNNRFTKCLIFLFKVPTDNKDFSHDVTTFSFDEDMILKQKINNNKNNKIGSMGIYSNYHGHKNNQDNKISQGHEQRPT